MRLLGFLALALAGLYGAAVLSLALGQRRLIYPGAWMERPPAEAVAGTEAITLRTADGESLHALWRAPQPGCGVVVSFHGNASVPEPHAERFSEGVWRQGGWGILAPSYRGYPGSTGSPTEDGLIRDGVAAYVAAAERAPGAPILLHGHSLGAAIAVAVAERAPHLGLYLEAPFDSMSHLVALRFPFVPSRWLLADTYRSDRRIAGRTEPVLIVQGTHDPVVPAKLAVRLASAAGPQAQLHLIPGDHVSIMGEADTAAEALFRGRLKSRCGAVPAQAAAP
ncbi:alpha/beta hydrolase [Methylobacterium sp. Leaf456]|uniref:alpha/beta hydrolase n=1 Tax=Methylobacterium sp. Leaf456 TaxID=1736382 RepID=UPI0006FDBB42|nr:alpha/beta hydrolase [Methylobacterium sp. Leaf456]KQT57630.1 alpha/beta hydrolase [Methylobacterium sp. Leaf456]